MLRTDLYTSASTRLSGAVSPGSGYLRLCFPVILICSCLVFGATRCTAQDVAEAARQERTRKESQQKKPKHVYTDQDLKRAQILTPEDRAQVEARKNQPTPPASQKPREAMDAQSLPTDAPLGDVARHFRKQKQPQKVQQSAEFRLPFADAPALASPKPPVQPLRPPVSNAVPRPLVRRSPFERPKLLLPAPSRVLPSHPPAVRTAPARPATPIAPAVTSAAKLNAVTVKAGDSLWKLAQRNLGHGARWSEMLPLNPGIRDPDHILAGSRIYLPPGVSPGRSGTKFTVRKGDTLSKIARTQLGHASLWSCIARANPDILDANLIHEGQILVIPQSCKP